MKPEATEETSPIITKGNGEWMCTESYGLQRKVVFDDETGEKTDDYIEFYIYNQNWDDDNDVYEKVSASVPTPENWADNWHHVAGTFDGTTLKLYIDDEEVASAEDTVGIAGGGNTVGIGADITYDAQNPNVPANFKGLIDNVRIYKTALSADELKNAEREADDNTVIWLDFDETTDKDYAREQFNSSAATGKTFRKETRTIRTSVQTDLFPQTEQYSLRWLKLRNCIRILKLQIRTS